MHCCLWVKDGIKNYPLNRYVVNRDGNGNVLEIVTKELIGRDVLGFEVPKPQPNTGIDESKGSHTDEVEVYTCVKLRTADGYGTKSRRYDNSRIT